MWGESVCVYLSVYVCMEEKTTRNSSSFISSSKSNKSFCLFIISKSEKGVSVFTLYIRILLLDSLLSNDRFVVVW